MSNIFLIHTEYHLLMTIRIILSNFKNCDNYIYIASANRIPGNYVSNYSNIHFRRLEAVNYGNYNTINEFISLKSENFFFFQDNSSDNIYIAFHLQRKKIKVALVQDGLKPYPKWHRKHLVLSLFRETFQFYMQMFRRKAVIPSLFLKSYKYGHLKYVDQLWVDYPDKLSSKTNKEIIRIPDMSKEISDEIESILSYRPMANLDNVILYIGQPLKPILWKKEIEIINLIKANNPQMQFLYKVHPNTKNEQLENYKSINAFSFVKDNIPAELIIAAMNRSIIVSIYSTALITNNPNCKFYWTRKLYGDSGIFTQLEIINPTSHIIEVENVSEIK